MTAKVNPAALRPAQLVRVLNGTALGPVASRQSVNRHRDRAGFRISTDGETVNLLRYLAWLIVEHDRPKRDKSADYEKLKLRSIQRTRDISLAGREIGPVPKVANRRRRNAAARSLRRFCETYFGRQVFLKWSPDHIRVLGKIERAVLGGELQSIAMPRGSGKTTLCELGAIWGIVCHGIEFAVLIGPDQGLAVDMLDSIKLEFETNDLFADDFPEVCFPIRALQGIHQRAKGQLCEGRPTHISWTEEEIVLPTIEGSMCSSAVIRVAGITGRIRGLKHKRACDGRTVRPRIALIDDPQTHESASSPSQCATRERILNGDILGLAGPGEKLAGLMTLTVIRPDDLADRMLDPTRYPQWQGERTKMVVSFPTNQELWDHYAELWRQGWESDGNCTAATRYYRRHRRAMDDGAIVSWAARFNQDEVSAIQHAMNLRYRLGDHAFFAEYQNEPIPDDTIDEDLMTAEQIAAKLNGYERRIIPIGATMLTMFIDVQLKSLFWIVIAWEHDFGGYVIDYGTEPEQSRPYVTKRDIQLSMIPTGAAFEGSLHAALTSLLGRTVGSEWRRQDGISMRINRCLVDANWQRSSAVVYHVCQTSPYASVLMPSHGRYVGASSIPFSEYKRKRGEVVGLNWRVPLTTNRRLIRHVVFDANYWKSFIHDRLKIEIGNTGGLTLWGKDIKRHRMLADHLVAEYRVRVRNERSGRTVDEWKQRAENRDNDLLDGAVGCAVGAAMVGARLSESDWQPRRVRRVRLSDMRRASRA